MRSIFGIHLIALHLDRDNDCEALDTSWVLDSCMPWNMVIFADSVVQDTHPDASVEVSLSATTLPCASRTSLWSTARSKRIRLRDSSEVHAKGSCNKPVTFHATRSSIGSGAVPVVSTILT